MRNIVAVWILLVAVCAGCGGGNSNPEAAAIEETIRGYVRTYNAGDFAQCLTHFTGYADEKDALAFLSFMRNLSGELELQQVKDMAIVPPAVPGSGPTATVTVVFKIAGEESTDQIELRQVDGQWKVVWAEESHAEYRLTHSAADAEYILSWDLIVSQCPDIGDYGKIEAFAYRGESVQISPGENFGLDADSPAAWASTRFVRTVWEGTTFRSFAVQTMFSEKAEDLDELVQLVGYPIQQEGDFVTGVLESETPMQSIQILLAGKHFTVLVGEFASADQSLFFDKDELMELISVARSNISMTEITPLPPGIPARES
jgi:hypothetical protein